MACWESSSKALQVLDIGVFIDNIRAQMTLNIRGKVLIFSEISSRLNYDETVKCFVGIKSGTLRFMSAATIALLS